MFRPLLLLAAFALGLASMPAAAQFGPPGAPLPATALAELAELQLSAAQRIELMQIFSRAHARHLLLRGDQEAQLADAADELAGDAPDLHRLAAEQEALTDARLAAIRQLRDDLLGFYDRLDADQQAQVHTWLAQQLVRIERAREALVALRDVLVLQLGG